MKLSVDENFRCVGLGRNGEQTETILRLTSRESSVAEALFVVGVGTGQNIFSRSAALDASDIFCE
jgi:hypothetical protein